MDCSEQVFRHLGGIGMTETPRSIAIGWDDRLRVDVVGRSESVRCLVKNNASTSDVPLTMGCEMKAGITFRPSCDEDEEFLRRVYASTRQEELAAVPWSDADKDAFLRMQFNAQHKYYHEVFTEAEYLVILQEGQPVGRLYLDRREEAFAIIDIALLPEHRRGGIGSSILQNILDEAASVGKPVQIHVERFNPALHLYERLGFVRTGDTGVYFLMEKPTPGSPA